MCRWLPSVAGDPLSRLLLPSGDQRITSLNASAAVAPAADQVFLADGPIVRAIDLRDGRSTPIAAIDPAERIIATAVDGAAFAVVDVGTATPEQLRLLSTLRILDASGLAITQAGLPELLREGTRPFAFAADDRLEQIVIVGQDESLERQAAYLFARSMGAWTSVGEPSSDYVAATVARDGTASYAASSFDDCQCAQLVERTIDGAVRSLTLDLDRGDGLARRVVALAAATQGELIVEVLEAANGFPAQVASASSLYRFDIASGQLEALAAGQAPLISSDGRLLLFGVDGIAGDRSLRGGSQLVRMDLESGEQQRIGPPLADLTARALDRERVLIVAGDELTAFDTNGDDVFVWRRQPAP